MTTNASPPSAKRRKAKSVLKGAIAVGLVGTALTLIPGATDAAVTATLTVDSLVYGGDDANPGDGVCATSTNICTLRAAVQESNALDAGPGDEVLINFAPSLSGFIVGPDGDNTTNRMKTGVIESGWDHSGAYYHITGRTRIDFGGDVGFTQRGDQGTGFFVDAPDVTIQNFSATATNPPGSSGNRTVSGITAGETAIVVSGNGDGFTLENGSMIETGSNWYERALFLQNGADNVTVRNVTFESYENLGGAIRVSSAATVSDLLLDGIVMNNSTPESHYYGMQVPSNVTLNNFRVVNSQFNNWSGDQIFYMHGSTINGGAFDNNTIDTVHRNRIRHLLDFEATTLSDFTFNDNLFNKVGADRVIDLAGTNMTNVEITGNTFQDGRNISPTNATSLNIFDVRNSTSTGLSIVNNAFNNVETVGGWMLADLRSGNHTNLDFSGNTLTNVDVTGSVISLVGSPTSSLNVIGNVLDDVDMGTSFLDMRSADSTNVEVASNTFDNTSANWPAIWTDRLSSNSSIHDNSWVNTDGTKHHDWIFVFDHGGYPATTNTGWAFHDNHIQVTPDNNEAPVRIDSGFLPVQRNTFAGPSRGTTPTDDANALSETGASWFVWNVNANANGKLRTWYPNAVEIDSGSGRARVTVQPPEASETPHPATPVAVDVYYTPGSGGQRQADVYLGRVEGLTAESTFEINCAGCSAGGYIRVQTIAANGATTQYSRIFQGVAGSVPVAGLTIDVDNGDDVPLGSTVTGTGTAGNTVEVINTDNNEVLCSTTVDAGGSWSCDVDFGTTTGPATITAVETDPSSNPVGSTTPVSADIVEAPAILLVTPGSDVAVGSTVSGTGMPGHGMDLWDTTNNELLCTTTVQPDGTWSCVVPFDATQGPVDIQATDTDTTLDSNVVNVDVVPAPVILNVGNDSDVPLGSTITGTGNPGETIEVVNTDNNEVLCTAVVDANGDWSCDVDDATTLGSGTLVANETGGGSSAPVPVTIVPAAVVPGTPVNDSENFVLDTPYTFEPLANDIAPTGATYDPTTLRLLDSTGNPQTTLAIPGEGTYTVNTSTGEVTFEPETGFAGPTNPVTYRVADTGGNTYEAQILLAAAPVVGVSMFGPGTIAGAVLAAGGLALIAARRRRSATS